MATLKPAQLLEKESFSQEKQEREAKLAQIKKDEARHRQHESRKIKVEEQGNRSEAWHLVAAAAQASQARQELAQINEKKGKEVRQLNRSRFEGRITEKEQVHAQHRQLAKANKKLDKLINKSNNEEQQQKQQRMQEKRQLYATAPPSFDTSQD
eukprot:gb/GEZN01019495.1/.p1 GENE.gb/GEZN01019495.1/~~gb/GEZN01019495.1/.p1  ORF type:complete len:154 (-),score=47.64 gb/GEZN01019495.1/:222-683(-)